MNKETIMKSVSYGNVVDLYDYKIKKATSEVEVNRLKEEKDKFIKAFREEEKMNKRKNAGAGEEGYNDKGNTQHPSPK